MTPDKNTLVGRLESGTGIGACLSGDHSFTKATMKEAADAIERQSRIIEAHKQQIKDGAELLQHWKSRALTAESSLSEAVKAAYEDAARIAERDTRPSLAVDYDYEPDWYRHGKAIASTIRARAAGDSGPEKS